MFELGIFDFLKKAEAPKEPAERIKEFEKPSIEERLSSLTGQNRATVVFNARKKAEKMNFKGVPWNSVGRYIDGVVRGEDKDYVRQKCNIDSETASQLDTLIERELDKVLY